MAMLRPSIRLWMSGRPILWGAFTQHQMNVERAAFPRSIDVRAQRSRNAVFLESAVTEPLLRLSGGTVDELAAMREVVGRDRQGTQRRHRDDLHLVLEPLDLRHELVRGEERDRVQP